MDSQSEFLFLQMCFYEGFNYLIPGENVSLMNVGK